MTETRQGDRNAILLRGTDPIAGLCARGLAGRRPEKRWPDALREQRPGRTLTRWANTMTKAVEIHTTPAPRRRNLLAGAAAVVALPAAVMAQPADPDARLIADCDAWLRLEVEASRIRQPWCWTPSKMRQPPRLQAYLARLDAEQEDLAERIEEAKPRTLAGFAALARVAMVGFDLERDGSPGLSCVSAAVVLCRALGGKSMAQLVREESAIDPVEPADAPAPMSALSAAFLEAVEADPTRRCTEAAMARYLAVQLRLVAEGAV